MIPPTTSVETQMAIYEKRLRERYAPLLASETERAQAEAQIVRLLESKRAVLESGAGGFQSLDVRW